MLYFLFPTTPPRPDELDKLIYLLGEVKTLTRQLSATLRTQENSEEVRNAKWTPA